MYCKAERKAASSDVVDVVSWLRVAASVVRVDGTHIPTADDVAVADASV